MKSKTESRTEKETEKEKVEGLMKPRWVIIADWIGNTQPIGDIFTSSIGSYYDNYPANLRRLHWAEFREEIEMPVYVKIIKNKPIYDLPVGCVRAVNGWDKNSDGKYVVCDIFPLWTNIKDIEPATKEEYEAYINKNK